MERSKWLDRKFTLDIPPGWMPYVLERLMGTEIRLRAMTGGIPEEKLRAKQNGSWSVLENIGHLTDLEELHEGRIDDFLGRLPVLRAADMKNEKTQKAGHNSKNLTDLLGEFSVARKRLTGRLSALDDETLLYQSMHPRLNVKMRPIDMAYFTAEHDDHHLAIIREIINSKQ